LQADDVFHGAAAADPGRALPSFALAATDISLALQNHFGHSLVLILFGQVVAAGGAAALALWLKRRE
jgi:hypothetical protein